ncbi:MAG: dTMP kinase [Pyrinomonadaceae bacterium]|nr:dTMP kinase [Pyrinomonadaceae bacterium]
MITFEGIDGSGKSTQMRMLVGELRHKEYDVLTTREPGGTPLGRRLRSAFLETEESVDPLAELLLFAADRAQHVNFLIKPAIKEGKIVLSDRFADATYAYQGAGRGFPKKTVNEVISLATGGLKPDLTLFFDLPVEVSLSRANLSEENDRKNNRMDSETTEFYEKVRDSYMEIAENEPDRFKIIDANRSIERIQADVVSIVTKFLESESQSFVRVEENV